MKYIYITFAFLLLNIVQIVYNLLKRILKNQCIRYMSNIGFKLLSVLVDIFSKISTFIRQIFYYIGKPFFGVCGLLLAAGRTLVLNTSAHLGYNPRHPLGKQLLPMSHHGLSKLIFIPLLNKK